jgi:ATP/maltotriose-dependent transcriptional regulator MalT
MARDLAERILRETPATSRTQRAAGLEILVRSRSALGEIADAAAALDELRAIASAVHTDPVRAAAGLASGAMEAASGQHEAARRSYEDATFLFQRSGAPFEAGCPRLALARSLGALGRTGHAAEQAGAAATVFERIGAHAALQDAEAFLAGLTPADAAGSPRLTGREREVLGLVARGLADRAIAEALVISEHTVHRHVSNILVKLGCRSRSAAVAEGLRDGLI